VIFQENKYLLGSDCLITLSCDTKEKANNLFGLLWDLVVDFENKFSRFKLDSELSLLNINAGKDFNASREMIEILKEAIYWAMKTKGLYNPFILPELQRAGYLGSWPKPTNFNPDLDFSSRKLHKIDALKISENTVNIPKDSALDLGGIGKGYLLKILSENIPEGLKGYWISLGGDIIADGFGEDDKPWEIAIEDAINGGELTKVSNNGRKLAVATSGTNRRSTKKWNHLIDPRTGLSTKSDILTATVVSNNPIEADILASCLVLLNSVEASKFTLENDMAALLQRNIETKYSKNIIYLGNKHTFIN
jgi:FAD:protein FMN transferase